jgi:hypothetical protein
MVCQLREDRWLQAGIELVPNIASAAPPQVRSASPRHRACDPHANLGRELNLERRQQLPIWRNGDCRKTDPVILPLHWLRPASEDARAADRAISHPPGQPGLPQPDGAT